MTDFERLGSFYLGREHDLDTGTTGAEAVLYDSRDLVTHCVIIGMTGSGKTGLGIALLEEAAIDGVPAIAIDPKGDLTNLMLTFPGLSPAEFRPWINEDEAARKGLTPDQHAEQQALAWKEGLAKWGQDGSRIARLRAAADLAIYTPGSAAGLPVSVLRSFDAPPREIVDDSELFAERVNTSITGLLTLLGVDADPVKSREHILLANVVGAAWRAGEDLDLGGLIERIQAPPMSRIGVLELEAFYPARERFELAMRLNGLLAAPGFAAWLEGDPLDVGRLLHTPEGRPRIAIVSIAHLADAERMFVVSLLLGQVLAWMRRQPGTTSLRALLYMDEVAGYMPPVANPPSKATLLTLLKQARAFGVGVVLATQNPVDLDYKGLSNAGTWFLGRLQTEQDKARVLDGLQGALGGRGGFDRASLDRLLSRLGKRIFLMNNVHDDAPTLMESRWAMSYLRGPLTREQIRTLMAGRAVPSPAVASKAAPRAPAAKPVVVPPPSPDLAEPAAAAAAVSARPVLPPDVTQVFAPVAGPRPPRYVPRLCGAAQVGFEDAKLGVREARALTVLVPLEDSPLPANWEAAVVSDTPLADFEPEPLPGGSFGSLPPPAARAKQYATWEKEFARWLAQTQALDLFREPQVGVVSKPGESERDFRVRLAMSLRERRDAEKTRLQQKYAPKRAALAERVRRAEEKVSREQDQASQQKVQTAVSFGATVIGALLGRKAASVGSLGRATTAARGVGRSMKEAKDVELAGQSLEQLRQQLAALDEQIAADAAAIDAGVDAATAPLDTVSIRPKRTQVAVQRVVLAWVAE